MFAILLMTINVFVSLHTTYLGLEKNINSHRIWITSETLLVKWTPGHMPITVNDDEPTKWLDSEWKYHINALINSTKDQLPYWTRCKLIAVRSIWKAILAAIQDCSRWSYREVYGMFMHGLYFKYWPLQVYVNTNLNTFYIWRAKRPS